MSGESVAEVFGGEINLSKENANLSDKVFLARRIKSHVFFRNDTTYYLSYLYSSQKRGKPYEKRI